MIYRFSATLRGSGETIEVQLQAPTGQALDKVKPALLTSFSEEGLELDSLQYIGSIDTDHPGIVVPKCATPSCENTVDDLGGFCEECRTATIHGWYRPVGKPTQLIDPEIVAALRRSKEFPEVLIEFLGWSQGRANTLNRSPNPVKSALTMLRNPDELNSRGERNDNTHVWLAKFYEAKKRSLRPSVETSMSEALAFAAAIERMEAEMEDGPGAGGHQLFADSQEQAELDSQ